MPTIPRIDSIYKKTTVRFLAFCRKREAYALLRTKYNQRAKYAVNLYDTVKLISQLIHANGKIKSYEISKILMEWLEIIFIPIQP